MSKDLAYNLPNSMSASERKQIRSIINGASRPQAIGPIASIMPSGSFYIYDDIAVAKNPSAVTTIGSFGGFPFGGEFFLNELPNLQTLYINGTANITRIDAQGLTSLSGIDCGGCDLNELNVQGSKSIRNLDCYHNNLTKLDLQGLTGISDLTCSYNPLTELNVQDQADLILLNCGECNLSQLDLHGLSKLKYVYVWNNSFSAAATDQIFLDLSGNGAFSGVLQFSDPTGEQGALARNFLIGRGWAVTKI